MKEKLTPKQKSLIEKLVINEIERLEFCEQMRMSRPPKYYKRRLKSKINLLRAAL